jgi:hypothetical protein
MYQGLPRNNPDQLLKSDDAPDGCGAMAQSRELQQREGEGLHSPVGLWKTDHPATISSACADDMPAFSRQS